MKYTIKTIVFNGDWANIEFSDGTKASANKSTTPAFAEMKDGQEVELDIKTTEKDGVKKNWANLPKTNGGVKAFAPKDVAWEKRKASLECAIKLITHNTVEPVKAGVVLTLAEEFHNYINQK